MSGPMSGPMGGPMGGPIENVIKKFGSIENRISLGKESNIQHLRTIFGVFSEYLNSTFGINSGKLQESFRKASGKPLPNWFLILELVAIYPTINAEDISKIIGVSERTIYKNFSVLQEKGLVERVGGRKEGSWQIIKQ